MCIEAGFARFESLNESRTSTRRLDTGVRTQINIRSVRHEGTYAQMGTKRSRCCACTYMLRSTAAHAVWQRAQGRVGARAPPCAGWAQAALTSTRQGLSKETSIDAATGYRPLARGLISSGVGSIGALATPECAIPSPSPPRACRVHAASRPQPATDGAPHNPLAHCTYPSSVPARVTAHEAPSRQLASGGRGARAARQCRTCGILRADIPRRDAARRQPSNKP